MEALIQERRPRVRPTMGASSDQGVRSTCSLSTCERMRPHGSLMWGYQVLPNGVSKSGRNQCWDDSGRRFTKSTLWVNGRRRDRGKSGLADTFTALDRIDSREMTYVSLSLKKRQLLPAPHFSAVSAALYTVFAGCSSYTGSLISHTGWCLREIPMP